MHIPDPLELYRNKQNALKSTEHIFKMILYDIVRQINSINLTSSKKSLMSVVPRSDAYVLEDCALYLKKALRTRGYNVKLLAPNNIYIDWNTRLSQEQQASEALRELTDLYPFIKVART